MRMLTDEDVDALKKSLSPTEQRKCCATPKGCGPHLEGCVNVKKPPDTGMRPHRAKVRDMTPDWKLACEVCGDRPALPATGMCKPCTLGEAND